MNSFAVENLFGIEGFNIAWYSIIIAIGMIAGVFLAIYMSKKYGISSETIFDFVPFAIREGGLAIFGGVIGGVTKAFVFCKMKKINFLRFTDVAIPSLLVGQMIGRRGNFTNQETFGNLVLDEKSQRFPFAVYIEKLREWHQATFFYESFLNLILLIVMLIMGTRVNYNGYALCLYLIGYELLRFMVEGLRTDSLYIIPGIRVSQVLALCLIPLGIVMWFFISKKGKSGNE